MPSALEEKGKAMKNGYSSLSALELRRQLERIKASLEVCEVSQIEAHCAEIAKIVKELRVRGLKVKL